MRGRKPKATVLHILNGTARPRNARPDEPQPVGNLLVPPEWMSEEQRAEWSYALDNSPPGLLRRLDRALFAQWCVASVDVTEAQLALRTEGKVVNRGGDQRITINADGSQTKVVRSASKILNPWVRAARDAFDRLLKTIEQLGFSPTSRSRITLAGGGKKEANRFSNNAAKRA